MTVTELTWVAVPGGRVVKSDDPGRPDDPQRTEAILRVAIVPRLRADAPGTLADYAMADWPTMLGTASIRIDVRDLDEPLPHRVVDHARLETWQRFFKPTMTVQPWSPPVAPGEPMVTMTADDATLLRSTYGEAAKTVADPATVRTQLARWEDHEPQAVVPPPEGDPEWQEPDFHRCVAMLREHPAVLRTLGLIVELAVPADALPEAAAGAPKYLQVSWPGSEAAGLTIVSPWTKYEYDGSVFLPASTSDIRSGMVGLTERSRWTVETVDVDNGAARMRESAAALSRRSVAPGVAPGAESRDRARESEPATMPTLRSAGLMLLRVDREERFRTRRQVAIRNASRESQAELELDADDLVLGYRIDVRRDGGDWMSLMWRTAHYACDQADVAVVEEEGHVKPDAMVREGGTVRADQVVTRWSGWSLAAQKSIERPTGRARARRGDAAMPYEFSWTFTPRPGTLPQLRFGHGYEVRARIADIAGGGLTPDDTVQSHATDLVPYTRFDPIPPPEVLRPDGLLVWAEDPEHPGTWRWRLKPEVLGPGGDLDQLVIRIDREVDPAAFTAEHPYPANNARTLVPPPTAFAIAEQHDALSDADERTWQLARRALATPRGRAPDGRAPEREGLTDPAARSVAVSLRPGPGGLLEPITQIDRWTPDWPDADDKLVELQPAPLGSPATLAWVGNTAVVRLAPAQEVVAEISSCPDQGDLGSFAISEWLTTDAVTNAAINGRHPMITPARSLHLVHAVRRPLSTPSGTVTPRRGAGETAVVLDPSTPLLGVDTASTGQLDVTASWDEWSDAPEPTPTSARLRSQTVHRGSGALDPIRHEFGDTKHRRVVYALTAVSRFRSYFSADDDESAFVESAELSLADVLSSARPRPPVVRSALPAFAWEGLDAPVDAPERVRTRRGGRLRVELARPWYTTGEGERLGVVVWPGDAGPIPEAAHPFLSWLHRDPIWATPSPGVAPGAEMFGGTAGERVRLADLQTDVLVVPYPVSLYEGSWYADVDLTAAAAASYRPFVRLAVGRYQPASVDDLQLSQIVRAEAVQVLPDRDLVVRRDGRTLHVELRGLGPVGPLRNRVTAVLESYEPGPGGGVDAVDLVAAGGPAEDTAEDTVEDAVEVAAWTRLPDRVEGELNQPLAALTIPAGPATHRLVVREIERFADVPASAAVADELTERTVFVDVVPLPGPDALG